MVGAGRQVLLKKPGSGEDMYIEKETRMCPRKIGHFGKRIILN